MNIEIVSEINASIENVWTAWNNPSDIVQWNFASNDWTCSSASNELVIGGKFNYRMQANTALWGLTLKVFIPLFCTMQKLNMN
ncbi:SRPBCC domain-containing protein [Thalassotalea piscium]|uniref:SRPBCC domain-containing protein n=1 Tax=Thalassotalea piscium TaxID=1230533 RepID=UPI001FE74000|nr:SRPBCC domain-containing protein [Thalassotalea piscium]